MNFFCDTCILSKGTYLFEERHEDATTFLELSNVRTSATVVDEYKNLNARRRDIQGIILKVAGNFKSPYLFRDPKAFIEYIEKETRSAINDNDEFYLHGLLAEVHKRVQKTEKRSVEIYIIILNELLTYGRARVMNVTKRFDNAERYGMDIRVHKTLNVLIAYENDALILHDFVQWHKINRSENRSFVTGDTAHIYRRRDDITSVMVKELDCNQVRIIHFDDAFDTALKPVLSPPPS